MVIGAVDLVDEQDGRSRAGMLDRLQERPGDEEIGREGAPLVHGLATASATRMARSWRA